MCAVGLGRPGVSASRPGRKPVGRSSLRCPPSLHCRPPPLPHPPPSAAAAAILSTLTTVVAHFLSAFPPLERGDPGLDWRQGEGGSCELRVAPATS